MNRSEGSEAPEEEEVMTVSSYTDADVSLDALHKVSLAVYSLIHF